MSALKPSWKNAPAWAKWLAQDGCGTWYWYEDRPIASGSGSRVFVRATAGSKQSKCTEDEEAWCTTLERRP